MGPLILEGRSLRGSAVYFGPADSFAGVAVDVAELRNRLRCACLLFDYVIIPLSYVYDDRSESVLWALQTEPLLLRKRRVLLSIRSTFTSLADAASHLCQYALRQIRDDEERNKTKGWFKLTTQLLENLEPRLVHFDADRTEEHFRDLVNRAFDVMPMLASKLKPLRDQTLERVAAIDYLTRTATYNIISDLPDAVKEAGQTLVTASYYVSGSNSVSSTILATPAHMRVLTRSFQPSHFERAIVPHLQEVAMRTTLDWAANTIGRLTVSRELLDRLSAPRFEELASSPEARAIRAKLLDIVNEALESFQDNYPIRLPDFTLELRGVENELEDLLQREIREDAETSVRRRRRIAPIARLVAKIFSLAGAVAAVAAGSSPMASGAFGEFCDFLIYQALEPGPFDAFRDRVVLSIDFSAED